MTVARTDDDVDLFYESTGTGVPIVFVHEFAGDMKICPVIVDRVSIPWLNASRPEYSDWHRKLRYAPAPSIFDETIAS